MKRWEHQIQGQRSSDPMSHKECLEAFWVKGWELTAVWLYDNKIWLYLNVLIILGTSVAMAVALTGVSRDDSE